MFLIFTHTGLSDTMTGKRQKNKTKASQEMNTIDVKIPKLSPMKPNLQIKCNFNSFVWRRSSEVQKLLTNKPSTVVAILRHVWDQEYMDWEKRVLMNKYWKRNEDSLASLMLDLGKHKGRKDDKKTVVQ